MVTAVTRGRSWAAGLLWVLLLAFLGGCTGSKGPGGDPGAVPTRPYLLGSSAWPPSSDPVQIDQMYALKRAYMDLAMYHQVEGVPWDRLAAGQGVPGRILAYWRLVRAKAGAGQRFYVALTPLGGTRSGLADLSTETTDHAPLPEEWAGLALDDPKVVAAYLAYCRQAIVELRPDFLALGIEVNILANIDPGAWSAYLALNRAVYTQLKQENPRLPIFVTVQYEHLQGFSREAQGRQALQAQAVRDLMACSDLLALSIYPYGPWVAPEVPSTYLDPIWPLASATGRTVAIAETGYPSQPFSAYGYSFPGSPALQQGYLRMLLDQADRHRMAFVVNWVAVDYDRLLEGMPPEAQELARVWVHDGLWDSAARTKPALAEWDAALARSYAP